MSAQQNKRLMQSIFDALAKGDGRPFVAAMSDDLCWTIVGTASWGRTYEGKEAVRRELLQPLMQKFTGPLIMEADHLVAEGDTVVAQCRGQATTKSGDSYDNRYCWVCRFREGAIVELTEYMDAHLAVTVLGEAL